MEKYKIKVFFDVFITTISCFVLVSSICFSSASKVNALTTNAVAQRKGVGHLATAVQRDIPLGVSLHAATSSPAGEGGTVPLDPLPETSDRLETYKWISLLFGIFGVVLLRSIVHRKKPYEN